jgi:hypothetical protein
MASMTSPLYTAFHGQNRIASGDLEHVAERVKTIVDRGQSSLVVIFDAATSRVIDLDLRGSIDDVLRRVGAMRRGAEMTPDPSAPRGPGRPRLGVVAREVTLLPRHWEWLNGQPGGASVALRRLVEDARRTHAGKDRVRLAQESAYRFMSAMAGDLPGFEEAARALFGGKRDRFAEETAGWPSDIREHAHALAAAAF